MIERNVILKFLISILRLIRIINGVVVKIILRYLRIFVWSIWMILKLRFFLFCRFGVIVVRICLWLVIWLF